MDKAQSCWESPHLPPLLLVHLHSSEVNSASPSIPSQKRHGLGHRWTQLCSQRVQGAAELGTILLRVCGLRMGTLAPVVIQKTLCFVSSGSVSSRNVRTDVEVMTSDPQSQGLVDRLALVWMDLLSPCPLALPSRIQKNKEVHDKYECQPYETKILGCLDQTGVGSVQENQEIWWEAPRGPAVRRAHNSARAAVSRAPSAKGTALQGLRFSLWEWVWLSVLPFFCPCG